jgi:hypothetical protein
MSVATEPGALVRSVTSGDAWDAPSLIAELRAERPARPFDATNVAFCAALSRALVPLRDVPQMVTLGYWLRPASLARMEAVFQSARPERVLSVPRGIALHITPANVDTLFAYSWLLSLLAGNLNIVRLSSRDMEGASRLLEIIGGLLRSADFETVRRRNRLVRFGHDDGIARTLSAAVDVRIVWGGDRTVDYFRQFPLPQRGRDVTFPDRHSLAILDVEAVVRASDDELDRLADRFFNDAYWFDQGACSSPRLVAWSAGGSSTERVTEARERFKGAVAGAVRRRGYEAQTGAVIAKLALAMERATSADGFQIDRRTNEATWVLIPGVGAYDRGNCGGGLFFELVSDDLARDLETLVGPEDQTAAVYGLTREAITELAVRLNGRGIDRWVPIGQALEFGPIWDGYDLLLEFSKRVSVEL